MDASSRGEAGGSKDRKKEPHNLKLLLQIGNWCGYISQITPVEAYEIKEGKRKQISAKDFLAFPSPTKLLQLGHNGGDALVEELGDDKKDPDRVVWTIIRLSLVVSKDDETKIKACECADSLLQNLFHLEDNAGTLVANAFLVYMGLLKGEDKKLKIPSSLVGPLLVLEHVAKQAYFPQSARQMLVVFLSKPHPLLENSSEARHKILQTLYSF